MRSERSVRWGVLALALAALGAAACSSGKSFVILTLETDSPALAISGVDQIVVRVSQSPSLSTTLVYPAHGVSIDQAHKSDLSVSFSGGQSGAVTLEVGALDANGCRIGRGQATAVLRKGSIARTTVFLAADNDCAVRDGGIVGGDASFPGCDPVTPKCGRDETCQVNCQDGGAAQCVPGGKGGPGASCKTNADCLPGEQCFDYKGVGCNVKLCLRFCNGETPCAQAAGTDGGAADGGALPNGTGTSSLCQGPVQCGALVTAYHTCTFGCDPRESAAAAKTSGCPTGLACLIVADMDQVDCACAEKTRVGTDGADCTGGAQCAPGYICNMMGGTKKCRAICRCDATAMQCTAPNDCTGASKTCQALNNDTTFGVCL